MLVYLIPPEKATEWQRENFDPIEDLNGNHVVAVNADYSQFDFNEELMLCEQITYQPKPVNP